VRRRAREGRSGCTTTLGSGCGGESFSPLKFAQARTPFFGSNTNIDAGTRDPTPQTWHGAQAKNLTGLNEVSVRKVVSSRARGWRHRQ
jgi:hypothetical protein